MFSKRYLGSEWGLITAFNSKLCVMFIPSEKNKVNSFSRLRKTWLQVRQDPHRVARVFCSEVIDLKGMQII